MSDMNTCAGTAMEKQMIVNTMEPAAHPTIPVMVMVMEAVAKLKKRGGVSLFAIKKYITEVHKVDTDKIAHHIRKAVRKAVTDGELVQTVGTVGANGSFKLPPPSEAAAKPKSIWSGPAGNFELLYPPTNWATDGATPILRVMIIRALEFFHAPGHNVDTRVSYEVINSYVQETFDVKTDCLKVLNEMVREGILTQSIDGKYSKRKREHKAAVKPNDSISEGTGATGALTLSLQSSVAVEIDESKSMLTVEKNNDKTAENENTEKREEFQYECGFCDSTFLSFGLRNEHTSEVHSDVQDFPCKYCGRLFQSISKLYLHFEIHSKNKNGTEKPFQCSDCNGGFNQKSQLTKHFRNTHTEYGEIEEFQSKPIKCVPCGLTFSSVDEIKLHREKIHVRRPLTPPVRLFRFECGICGLAASSNGEIKIHMEDIHDVPMSPQQGGLRFECGICPKTCVTQESRVRHTLSAHKSATFGSQSDTIGSQSDTIGSQSDTIGSQSDTIGSQSDTVGSQSDTIGSIRNDSVGTFFPVRVKEKTEVALLNPELVTIVKSEPEEFVFTDYLNKSPLPGNEPGISCTVPDLRILITDALKFLNRNLIMDSGSDVSYELIDSYLKETFKVRTDCLTSVLNAMVLQGIVIRSDDAKYKLGPTHLDVEDQHFNRLMAKVLTTPEDSPVSISEIQKYLKRQRKGFVKLLARIEAFLQIGLGNETILRIPEKTCFRYRLANTGEKQRNHDLDKEYPGLGKLKTNETPLEQRNQCKDMYMDISQLSPQISETVVVTIENVEVEVKIENETENFDECINQMWTPEDSGPSNVCQVVPHGSGDGDDELKFEYGMSFL